MFVRSEDNEADLMTKNPTMAENERHSIKLVDEVPEILISDEHGKIMNTVKGKQSNDQKIG